MSSPTKNQPIDKGWAWVILLAAFMESYLLMGTHASFGIYFKEFLVLFDTSASSISFALSVQTIFISVGSLLIMSVGCKFVSTRVFVMLGGLTAATAYMLNSFAQSATFLMLSQGVFFGMTHAFCHGPILLTLGKYFHEKRGFATTLASIGSSVGGLTMPLLVRYLIDEYGIRGSLMVVSGILLNLTTMGALLRPLSLPSTSDESDLEDVNRPKAEQNENYNIDTRDETNKPLMRTDLKMERNEKGMILYVPEKATSTSKLNTSYDRLFVEPIERLRTYSASTALRPKHRFEKRRKIDTDGIHHTGSSTPNDNELYKNVLLQLTASNGDIAGGSAFSINSLESKTDHANAREERDKTASRKDSTRSQLSPKVILLQIFDKKVIFNRLFLMFLPVAFLAIVGVAQILTYIPPHAASLGISDKEVSYLFIISGGCDALSKLVISFIADCGCIRRYQIVAICIIVSGIVINLISCFTVFSTMVVLAAVNGLFSQVYFGLFPVLLTDFVGLANLSSAIGIVMLIHGFSLSVCNPILGFIRDETGSFEGSFHFMGTCSIISGAILLTEPIFRKLENQREHE